MFKTFIYRFCYRMFRDDIPGYAAQISFYLLLSIFPFLVMVGTILARANMPGLLHYIDLISSTHAVPEPVTDLIKTVVRSLKRTNEISYLVYTVLVIYSASKVIRGIMKGIYMVYHTAEARSLMMRFLISFFYTFILAILIVVFIGLVLFGSSLTWGLFKLFKISAYYKNMINLLKVILPIILMFITYLLMYRFFPSRNLRFRDVYIGAISATAATFIMSRLFALYVTDITNYTTLYGSISSFIIILIWFYFFSYILLVGAEINATIEEIRPH